MQDALLVVDMQKDFCEGGALAASDTESVIDPVNELIDRYNRDHRLVIFSRDWHPKNHCSFKEQGGPWPPHCVAGTVGAEFHDRLLIPACHLLVSKGTAVEPDAYSAFQRTDLAPLLKRLGIETLAICGLTTEHCVHDTYSDAVENDFKTVVHRDAIRPVQPGSDKEQEALEKFATV